ncbi:sensor histidine kinase [Paenibacillus sp. MSJ-34]|uniref:sensor histidine kinase n=1 Tax=Paenibacillus sp. MSJ-34 TaxID=2841529 RepID=UPI001C0F6B49|nr:sensor histidine kinase [Paenibacillus sp. MSJ-34]MBU5442290.1 sensor histidine kinase [Paenibacillus sp. MSJ-34]
MAPLHENRFFRRYYKVSLKSKFIVTNLLVVFIPILIIGTLFYNYTSKVIQSEATAYKKNIVKLMGQHVDNYIFQLKQLTYSFYQTDVQKILPDFPDGMVARYNYNDKLFSYLYASSHFTGIEGSFESAVFIRPDGTYHQTGINVIQPDFDFGEMPWYREASNSTGKINIYTNNSRPYLVIPPNDLSISIVRNIYSIYGDGNLGVLLIDIPLSQINKLFSQFELKTEDNIYLIDRDGRVLFSSIDDTMAGKQLDSVYYDWIGGEFSGNRIININNERILVTYYATSNTDWKMISIDRMADLKATLLSLKNRAILLAAIALAVGVFIAWFFSSHITRAISFLQMRMRKFQEGDFNTRIRWVRQDEIGKLGESFNEMAYRINDLIQHNYVIQIKNREAQFKALQAQINPHFLYNTLDSISNISLVQNVPLVGEISNQLADMLRYSISNTGPVVTLREELDHVQAYLSIQNIRYTNKFHIIWDIHPEALDFNVIKLTLQPIVENAIYHGLEMKMGQGTLRITAEIENDRFIIDVVDNGLGIPAAKLEQLQEKLKSPVSLASEGRQSEGIGLVNVQERIRLQFGDSFGLQLQSGEQGTSVKMVLPIEKVT